MNSQRAAWRMLRAISALQCRRFTQFGASPGVLRPTAAIPMPYITEVTAGGWRTSDVFSKLLQERIIFLNGAIDDTVSAAIVAQLLWLESDNPDKPITMYINSPGGEVSSGLAIYDTMTYIKSPVSTLCVGSAASMAAILLLGGEPGKRYALPHSSIMVHQPLGGTRGQASDILIYATQIQRLREQINKIVQSHVNKSLGHEKYDMQAINDLMERDKYLSADEAKDLGIVDEILSTRVKEDGKLGSAGTDAKSPKP
ncbi:Clp protease-domain-containing protein [Podospora didyma]|uniref:ATP-dependent Clp protease proteolytic subunit n=1 Tax=Podospora didyma TaxID=330526 RepID=A0AAE0K5L3_9PEZI|nr:Clp protease-domain-containing protein [Podospora didyma]